jgi:hypothetical protein
MKFDDGRYFEVDTYRYFEVEAIFIPALGQLILKQPLVSISFLLGLRATEVACHTRLLNLNVETFSLLEKYHISTAI